MEVHENDYINEKQLKNYPKSLPLSKMKIIMEQMDKAVFRIHCSKGGYGTGFFCLIPFPDKRNLLPILVTNNHIIEETDIIQGNNIIFNLNNNKSSFNLDIKDSRKFYTNYKYDITFIEIKDEDGFDINFLLEIDNEINKIFDPEIYKDKSIYLLHYPHSEKIEKSEGVINYIYEDGYNLEHFCSSSDGSSGGPILDLITCKVLLVHKGTKKDRNCNVGTFLKIPIEKFNEEYKNKKNDINYYKFKLKVNKFLKIILNIKRNEKKIFYKNIPKDLGNNLKEKIKIIKEVINNIKMYKKDLNFNRGKLYKKKIIRCSTTYGNYEIQKPDKTLLNTNYKSRRKIIEIIDNSNIINKSRSPIKVINLKRILNTEINNSNLINPKDLIDFYYKFNSIIILPLDENKIKIKCFEIWNYYYNCSLYKNLEKLLVKEESNIYVEFLIKNILLSVIICYELSYKNKLLYIYHSFLVDLFFLINRNLIIIFNYILNIIDRSNIWIPKIKDIIDNFIIMDEYELLLISNKKLSFKSKIKENINFILPKIKFIINKFEIKTKRVEKLFILFDKIKENTYEDINSAFINIFLREENLSEFAKIPVYSEGKKEKFKTVISPYIKVKNSKLYSLVLNLDNLLYYEKNNNDKKLRQRLIKFLEKVGKYYELILSSCNEKDYVNKLADMVEKNNIYFEIRFYKLHYIIIGNEFIFDLNRIGRSINKIIVIDNPLKYRLQKENVIDYQNFFEESNGKYSFETLGEKLIKITNENLDVSEGIKKYIKKY